MVIRKVGALSVGKVLGILYAILGLFIGAAIAVASMLGFLVQAGNGGDASPLAVIFSVAAVVILPVFYGVLGFIFGAIGSLVYNVVASMVGGIELTVDTGGPA